MVGKGERKSAREREKITIRNTQCLILYPLAKTNVNDNGGAVSIRTLRSEEISKLWTKTEQASRRSETSKILRVNSEFKSFL